MIYEAEEGKQLKKKFSYRMPADVCAFVEKVSVSLDISINSALTLIVRQYLAEHPENLGVIHFCEGGIEVVNVPVPSADDVVAWNYVDTEEP